MGDFQLQPNGLYDVASGGLTPQRAIQERFAVKASVREELHQLRAHLSADKKMDSAGNVHDEDAWRKVPKGLRLASVGLLLSDVANKRDLR